eukprot:XP_001700713.1 predicted protein [Chlamydomonas reinhardtii]
MNLKSTAAGTSPQGFALFATPAAAQSDDPTIRRADVSRGQGGPVGAAGSGVMAGGAGMAPMASMSAMAPHAAFTTGPLLASTLAALRPAGHAVHHHGGGGGGATLLPPPGQASAMAASHAGEWRAALYVKSKSRIQGNYRFRIRIQKA